MDTMLAILLSLLITLVASSCLLGTVIGLPGNWVLVGGAALAAWGIAPSSMASIPSWSVLFLFVMALVGEGVEFAAGALGVGKLGGAKRSAALAIVGSLIGAIVGMFVGLPIPIVGSLIASVLCGGAGAATGAILGERWKGNNWDGSVEIGFAAFWGKLLGTVGKAICGAVMAAVVIVLAWT